MFHPTVYKSRDARWGPVGYCSSSILGSANGAMSCETKRAPIRKTSACKHMAWHVYHIAYILMALMEFKVNFEKLKTQCSPALRTLVLSASCWQRPAQNQREIDVNFILSISLLHTVLFQISPDGSFAHFLGALPSKASPSPINFAFRIILANNSSTNII